MRRASRKSEAPDTLDRAVRDYERDGFAVVRVFDNAEAELIERFAKNWVRELLHRACGAPTEGRSLATYHEWWNSVPVDHATLFSAANRYTRPVGKVSDALLNTKVWNFLSRISPGKFEIWDEGIGWLGFRFIRPGMNDGYPPSRKQWGPAKKVVSCWIPVIGHTEQETLSVSPGSHLRDFDRHLPGDSKFCPDEYRLANPPPDLVFLRPPLSRGEVIFSHPRLIHTEDVRESTVTRLNLEVRFNPLEVAD